MIASMILTHSDHHLIITANCEDEIEALRLAVRYNLRGWDTCRVERLGDGTYLLQMSRHRLTELTPEMRYPW